MQMKKAKSRSQARPSQTAKSSPPSASSIEMFPPPTISSDAFLKNGSDREFRLMIYDLIKLSNQLARNRRHFATYIGVSDSQWLMMMIIAETRDATVGYLAQQLNVTSQFVTIEIGDLAKKNIVEKQPNENDRRSMILSMTAKGKGLLREASSMV